MKFFDQYKGVASIFKRYWSAYGGWKALICSPYLHLAIVLMALSSIFKGDKVYWFTTPLAVLPNMLAITFCCLAIFVAFGGQKFTALLSSPTKQNSGKLSNYYKSASTAFIHFIIIQTIGLILASVASTFTQLSSCVSTIWMVIGYFFFYYALTSVLAVTFEVYRTISLYAQYCRQENDDQEDN
jgi:hypothetical protein